MSAAAAECGDAPAELTAKQVRELRRLCRKTANRAEYDDRSVQVRQIASILAMGSPSLRLFAPGYWNTGSALQAWVDRVRADGADWRDERILLPDSVDELRDWDRLLKIWAKRRFASADDEKEDAAAPATTTPARKSPVSRAPRTPLRDIQNWQNSAHTASASSAQRPTAKWMASPVSTDEQTPLADRMRRTRSGLPQRESRSFGTPITPVARSVRSPELITPRPRLVPAPRMASSSPVVPFVEDSSDSECNVGERPSSESETLASREYDGVAVSRGPSRVIRASPGSMSISRDGKVINVDIPRRSAPAPRSVPVGDENASPHDAPFAMKSSRSLKSMGEVGVSSDDGAVEKVRDWGTLRASARGLRPALSTVRHDYANVQSTGAERLATVGADQASA